MEEVKSEKSFTELGLKRLPRDERSSQNSSKHIEPGDW